MNKVENKIKFNPKLIAPCGMNCGICSGYLAYSHQLPKKRGKITYCIGCRARDKKCAWLKKRCKKLMGGKVKFCYECKEFPCYNLKRLDDRYRDQYNYSFVENLKKIKKDGIKKFLKSEECRWRCPRCGGTICVHNGKCYDCEKVTSWKR